MKPEIQQYMEERIAEIRSQNTMFDIAVTTIETAFDDTMTPETTTQFVLSTDKWRIYVSLAESLYDGVVTVSFNRATVEGMARIGSMTITSQGVMNESYHNIDTVENRSEIFDVFSSIFSTVKQIIDGDDNSET